MLLKYYDFVKVKRTKKSNIPLPTFSFHSTYFYSFSKGQRYKHLKCIFYFLINTICFFVLDVIVILKKSTMFLIE